MSVCECDRKPRDDPEEPTRGHALAALEIGVGASALNIGSKTLTFLRASGPLYSWKHEAGNQDAGFEAVAVSRSSGTRRPELS